MIRALEVGSALTLFADEFRTPVSGGTAAAGILLSLDNGPMTIHLGGRERISRYDFGIMLARCLGKGAMHIRAALRSDVPMAAARPADVSLNSGKAYALGYDPMPLEKEVAALECIMKSATS